METFSILLTHLLKHMIYKTMHELPRMTSFGHELGDLPMIFTRDFVTRENHGKSPHEWPKIVIYSNECIILFLTCSFMPCAHNSTKNNHQSLISQLSLRTVCSDLALWCHQGWSMMSSECEVLVLWRHIRRLFLHVQIGTKMISTSE